MSNIGLPIILPVAVLSLFVILVCVVAALLLLWRCYCAKHHKHNTSAHPHSPPPPVEEMGQALYSVVQDEEEEDDHQYSHLQHGTNRVRGGAQLHVEYSTARGEEDEEDMGILPQQPAPHPSHFHGQVHKTNSMKVTTTIHAETAMDQLYDQMKENINKSKEVYDGSAEESRGVYSAITNRDLQNVYTQVDRKKEKESPMAANPHVSKPETAVNSESKRKRKSSLEGSGAVYAVITTPDPQSVYTQVDRKKTIEVCASSSVESGTIYAALTNLDPQSVYTQVGQKKVKGVMSEDSKPHNSLQSHT